MCWQPLHFGCEVPLQNGKSAFPTLRHVRSAAQRARHYSLQNSFTFFAVPWLCRFRTEKEAEIKRTPTAVKENTVFLLCFRYSFPRHLPTRFFSTSSFLYREITGVAVWRIRLEGSHGCMVVGWELCRKPAFLLALEGV